MTNGLGFGDIQIGPSYSTSIREIAEAIVEISGKQITIQYDRSKPEGDKSRCADFGKAKKVLGWEPKVKLKDGLTRLYNWVATKIK
jgi:GDP-D-mannose 3',5'-epimerase